MQHDRNNIIHIAKVPQNCNPQKRQPLDHPSSTHGIIGLLVILNHPHKFMGSLGSLFNKMSNFSEWTHPLSDTASCPCPPHWLESEQHCWCSSGKTPSPWGSWMPGSSSCSWLLTLTCASQCYGPETWKKTVLKYTYSWISAKQTY